MNIKMLKAAFAGLVLSVSGLANAGLINIKYIEIENALDLNLQVSEFIAWGTDTNTDLALTGTATASANDYYDNSCSGNFAACVLDGLGPLDFPNIYHGAGGSTTSLLTITFTAASNISWIEILGRDGCCSERDVYNIRFFDEQRTQLWAASDLSAANSAHSTGRVEVPEPTTLTIFALSIMGLASLRFKKQ